MSLPLFVQNPKSYVTKVLEGQRSPEYRENIKQLVNCFKKDLEYNS